MSPQIEQKRQPTEIDFFSKQLAPIWITGEQGGKRVGQIFTAWLYESYGAWFLITAGHVWIDIKAFWGRPDVTNRTISIADRPPERDLIPLPFYFPPENEVMILGDHDKGNDYAVIPLYKFIRRALQDAGKIAFTSANVAEAGEKFDYFWLIGVPEEGTISEEVMRVDREKITFNISLHQLTPLSKPPGWRRQKTGERLFCKVELGSMKSVKGLSGGPIIGVKELGTNNYSYKVVGIQSGWCPQYKEIEAYSALALTSNLDFLGRSFVESQLNVQFLHD